MKLCNRFLFIALAATLVASCSHQDIFDSELVEEPKLGQVTQSARLLSGLPPAKSPVAVSVYAFEDLTGQLKPNNNFAEYSRAVTQGGLAVLNKALLNAANGKWFTVVERGGLRNLLQEREIITMMRQQYTLPDGSQLEPLPPLLYAGMIIEGGIVGYDSNIVTGGLGAKYLGIGGDTKHQRDIVTVDLRAVNVSTGQVLLTVTSEKTIYSSSLQGNIFKYIAFDKLLEVEGGVTMNEPPQLAVRQAVDTAVYSLVMEGARRGMWEFGDAVEGRKAMAQYELMLDRSQKVDESKLAAPTTIEQTTKPLPPDASKKSAAGHTDKQRQGIIEMLTDALTPAKEAQVDVDNVRKSLPSSPPVPLPAKRTQ